MGGTSAYIGVRTFRRDERHPGRQSQFLQKSSRRSPLIGGLTLAVTYRSAEGTRPFVTSRERESARQRRSRRWANPPPNEMADHEDHEEAGQNPDEHFIER